MKLSLPTILWLLSRRQVCLALRCAAQLLCSVLPIQSVLNMYFYLYFPLGGVKDEGGLLFRFPFDLSEYHRIAGDRIGEERYYFQLSLVGDPEAPACAPNSAMFRLDGGASSISFVEPPVRRFFVVCFLEKRTNADSFSHRFEVHLTVDRRLT